jgi:hypothetical protein
VTIRLSPQDSTKEPLAAGDDVIVVINAANW